ncbi:hypothetical protein [Desulfonatronovibrio magnus]|uniref:hypothetical protein n=1 Tax=Desulfonatronovibrio magnus TaxID=698827 RepID=UPI0005EB578B|nr:hypothetical protein [Desulfonatronovibrio magnus]RQD66775.1 MAG: hypothetical protein D5R98_01795 [Desulfonatronovibrio sp. MSAO_Bac4]
MGKVTTLPAQNCIYYRFGFCVYEETLNPGFDVESRCLVLMELEEKYDHLLSQADNFDLNQDQVHKIWVSRFGENVMWEDFCRAYMPRSRDDDRCSSLFGNACIKLFPECGGRCPHYMPERC